MKKIIWPVLLGILLLSGCSSDEEKEARETAESYMEAVKNGDEFEDIYSAEEFADVFNYDYIKTLEDHKEKWTFKTTYEDWKKTYESSPETYYSSFDEFKEAELQTIDSYQTLDIKDYQVIKNTDTVFEYWDGENYKYSYTFLYNVEIANEEGQKLFKKAEITVESGASYNKDKDDYEIGFLISDITLR